MQKNQFGFFLIATLVALRVGIGMHFFREGVNKVRDPKPFSAAFFASAEGPLAISFQNLAWDRDGLTRLNIDSTLQAWDQFRARVERHYGFDANQNKQAADILQRYERQLRDYLAEKADDIREYRGNVQRRDEYLQDPQRMETPSLRKQVERIENDVRNMRAPLVRPIDALWEGYARDLNALAKSDQRGGAPVQLTKLGRRLLDSETIDKVIPWFDMTIGALLIMGLGTRIAAMAGAAFLFSVLISQWPTASGSIPTWPQFIEALGLLVLAAAGAGRYAGFDVLFCAGCCRRRSNTQGTQS